MEAQKNNPATQQQEVMSIKDLLYLCLARWQWFLLSLVVCMGVAIAYLLITPPVYTRTASILIKDNTDGKSASSDLENFGDFGMFTTKTNVNNEIGTLKSPDLMREVVTRLHLNVNYTTDGRFHVETLYGDNLPLTVRLLSMPEGENVGFDVELAKDGTVKLYDFTRGGGSIDADDVETRLGQTVQTPLGKIEVKATSAYKQGTEKNIHVQRIPLRSAVTSYSAGLTVEQSDTKSNIISISFNDVSTQRAEDVLGTIISVYNENWVKDKNQIAVSTSQFINERLGVIEGELGHVDNDISSFKSANLVPDVQAAASMYMTQASEAATAVSALNNQAYMARYIRNYLTSETNKFQLLPANSGIENATISSQITEYNNKLLDRNGLVSQSSTQNPLVVEMDKSLAGMRSALVRSIDNQLVSLNEQIRSQQGRGGAATSKIASNPKQSKYLLSVERQQKVKESLYLYLLQKREENELSQAFTAYNTRVITMPGGSNAPTSPVSRNILLAAFALGLVIPAGIIFIRENMNSTVRGKSDLKNLTLPFIGEIPLFVSGKRSHIPFLKKKLPEVQSVVVKEGSRNVINEAFRVLRTNLEFMSGSGGKSNVIVITSFNPGSGKSFLAMNMGVSLAIKGKKVLVIDGDLRHGSASQYVDSPEIGFSDYLGEKTDDLKSIIVTDEKCPNLSVLPIGTIPPNPTELLFNKRLEEVINGAREWFDYVLIDCPPIELVADTQIIEKLADRTIFVVRAGLLERSMLPELQNIYDEKKFKNMSVVLNGTEGSHGRYGYKYGYRYGYHYGYGYGYHYGSDKKREG